MLASPQKTALIVEDNPHLLNTWARTLRRFGWSVDTAKSLKTTNQLLDTGHTWNVALLDLLVEDGNTITIIPRLNHLEPKPAIAIISAHLDAKTIVRDLHTCAITIPKPASGTHVAEVLEVLRRKTIPRESVLVYGVDRGLSKRETAVLLLAMKGMRNQAIATKLGVTPGTLSTYWQRMFTKTGCSNREEVLIDIFEFRLGM